MRNLSRISCLFLVVFFTIAMAYYEGPIQILALATSALCMAFYSIIVSTKKSKGKRGFILKGEKLIQI